MADICENQPAYILHRRPYRESSYILDIFALNYGRLSLVGKGAGNTSSRKTANNAAVLQPFQPLVLSWSGKSSLKTLRNVDTNQPAFKLTHAYLYCGYYLNELMIHLLPESEAVPELFVLYARAIKGLSEQMMQDEVLRPFEYRLLQEMGYLPSFEYDLYGDEILPEKAYTLIENEGFKPTLGQAHSDGTNMVEPLRFEGSMIKRLHGMADLDSVHIETNHQVPARRLMRRLVDGALQGKKLKSREMFRAMYPKKS